MGSTKKQIGIKKQKISRGWPKKGGEFQHGSGSWQLVGKKKIFVTLPSIDRWNQPMEPIDVRGQPVLPMAVAWHFACWVAWHQWLLAVAE